MFRKETGIGEFIPFSAIVRSLVCLLIIYILLTIVFRQALVCLLVFICCFVGLYPGLRPLCLLL